MTLDCIYCKGNFKSAAGLTNHVAKCIVKAEHEKQAELALQVECTYCHNMYKNQKGLSIHILKCPVKLEAPLRQSSSLPQKPQRKLLLKLQKRSKLLRSTLKYQSYSSVKAARKHTKRKMVLLHI